MRGLVLTLAVAACSANAVAPDADTGGGSFGIVVDVTGLASGKLVVTDNGVDKLDITADGSYTFARRIGDGRMYHVVIQTQPAGETCMFDMGDGIVHGADVHIAIACGTTTYAVGGNLSGIAGTVVLQNNGADELSLTTNGPFMFPTRLVHNATYAVTVATQPATRFCSISMGSGMVDASDITTIAVACSPTYAVGGNVTGLSGGSITIKNNGGDAVTLAADGMFTFPTRLGDGAGYHVTVQGPAGQLCTPANGDGTIAGADVSNIAITCVEAHTVGGTVSGLANGTTLVLKNNGGDAKTITTNGGYTFLTPVALGATYHVTIGTPASGQLCTIANDSGTIAGDVGNVDVSCRAYAVALDEIYARPAAGALGDTNGDNTRDSAQDEFVEVINNEAFAVALDNYVILTGAATPAVRFTFPAGTSLAAGQRAVVFGGGAPAGSFGSALVFASGGLALPDAPAAYTVRLDSAAAAGVTLDTFAYDATTFGSSCTTTCASQTRSPSGTGAFVAHGSAAGNAGILWSPGVAPTAAIPKLNTALSSPPNNTTNFSIASPFLAQFNMLMDTTTFDSAHLKLYQSPCAALANEVATTVGVGADAAKASIVPTAPLAYAQMYCLAIAPTTASAIGVGLAALATIQVTTRAAMSAPAANVVISEVGGCRLAGSVGGPCATQAANDEFIELYNPTNAAIDISGWFVQRRSAAGSPTCDATIPAATTIAANSYYLIATPSYVAANYPNAPAPDLVSTVASLMTGTSESFVLITSTGTCTGSTNIVDAVSYGAITDTLAALELPATATPPDGHSVERKACFDSTGDTSLTTGLVGGGGHVAQGNSEHIGASNADWVDRPGPNPQNATATEVRTCN